MDIAGASDDVVKVQLIGAGTLIKSVRSEKLGVIVDLSNLPVGTNRVSIFPSSVSSPPGVEVNRITPSEIEVTLDRSVTKAVPVQIEWTGRLPEDLLITEASVEPKVVQVTGRSLILKALKTLYTNPVSLDGIEKSGQTTIPVVLPENIKLSTGQKDRVTVFYNVLEREEVPPFGGNLF